ncbi:MAG: hypothetical protein ACRD68_08385, partial [Pyrinomonadaceae bacterium]
MKRKIHIALFAGVMTGLAIFGAGAAAARAEDDDDGAGYEVWVMDQSDTRDENGDGTPESGGTLYIYRGDELVRRAARAVPERIDFGGTARDLCVAQTGTPPRRPHMFFFNASRTHAIVSFVASGHVLFMETATRAPVKCLDVGVQAHSSVPSHDETYIVVANQNGRLLQRINTDYEAGAFTLDNAATIDLATCTTPSGAPCQDPILRPDTRPICPIIDSCDRFTFVTLAGGGLFVVDANTTPMSIVTEYD